VAGGREGNEIKHLKKKGIMSGASNGNAGLAKTEKRGPSVRDRLRSAQYHHTTRNHASQIKLQKGKGSDRKN